MSNGLETRATMLWRSGVTYIDPASALYESMVTGYTNQMKSRRLNRRTIEGRLRQIRAFRSFAEFRYPWQWTANLFDEFMASLVDRRLALGTLRSYQGDIYGFISYLRDPDYGWQPLCRELFLSDCPQICHEGNMITHASDYEGEPEKRAFTYDELERFFACADARFTSALASGRKGAMAAFRNAVMMKLAYAWGPRRNALRMLDTTDFSTNAKAPQFGQYGVLTIRYGKAVRGGQPRRYVVLSIVEFEWAVKAIKQYVDEFRPHSRHASKPYLFLTERGTRISKEQVDIIFASIRDEVGLPKELTLHCLRHSFSSHQTEWGYDRAFVQEQLGHEHPSTTSTYTHVSSDFKQQQINRGINRSIQRGKAYPSI